MQFPKCLDKRKVKSQSQGECLIKLVMTERITSFYYAIINIEQVGSSGSRCSLHNRECLKLLKSIFICKSMSVCRIWVDRVWTLEMLFYLNTRPVCFS